MSWPPKEQDLYPDKTMLYIPHLLDIFCMVVISGKLNEGDSNLSERTIRLKNSVAQNIVYTVSNGTIKTPESVLFPTIVKSLCEVIKIINQYRHSYYKVEEIEMTNRNKVALSPECVTSNSCESSVALMVADNIDNLENTMTGSGTSHRVNSILVTMKVPETNQEVEEGQEEYCCTTKRKCQRSLPPDAVSSEIPDYYEGKRVGPGKLNEVKNLS